MPTYQQTVTCLTRGNATLDKMFCNIRNGYRAYQKPKLGDSDHNMVFLSPSYLQKLKCEKYEKISVQNWKNNEKIILQGCFKCTDWDVLFSDTESINYNLDVFNSYVNFCTEMITPIKEVNIYPNSKPWINSSVKLLVKEKKRVFAIGDRNRGADIQRQLKREIKDAKYAYKIKIENNFKSNKPKDAWNGVKMFCGLKRKQRIDPSNPQEYVNELNPFYSRFDIHDFNEECNNIMSLANSIT